ncbi:MAG: hypothetical protein B7X93_07775 [Hydrogenophilales bacterium 17-61-9]|nr:MAG: hypothetical protein B7Y33_03625 [Hydrogenophilales bacterium 16-62-9]OZA28209.1 MAG: hypothetical protein B7X93_07775 [Hydrogenophilales bacterium 17-61-9]
MTGRQRRTVLFLALAGVAAWSIWLAGNESSSDAEDSADNVAEPKLRNNSVSPVAISPAPIPTPAKTREAQPRLALARTNLFPEQTWFVRPPPPPPYVIPPPQAPALPFGYMGRWQEADQTTYYLVRGTQPLSVRAGQVLDGVWQLEPMSNGILNFTYLPLNQTRSLRTGD